MPTAPTGPATRAHRRTRLAACRLQDQGLKHGPRPSAVVSNFPQQSFGYCPRAKRSRGNTRAGLVGYLFETVHNAIAPVWHPGAYIRSCELSSVVERAHSNVARKTKGWLEHEIHHAAETREA